MWTVTIRRNLDNKERSFELVNGKFEAIEDLTAFSQSSHLFISRIEGNNHVVYEEHYASQQIVLYDGKAFLYSNLGARVYSSLYHLVSLIVFIRDNSDLAHIESVERSSIIYFSAVLEGFISELGKSITNIRKENINQVQSNEFFGKQVNNVLNRFNNPKKKNVKLLLRDLSLYPTICERIDFTIVDEIVENRNRIAHGAIFNDNLNFEIINEYYRKIKVFLEHFSREFYLELSKGDEINWLFDVRFQTKNGQDKMWNLLPILIEEIELKTGYNN
jgi:hypothetical protein